MAKTKDTKKKGGKKGSTPMKPGMNGKKGC